MKACKNELELKRSATLKIMFMSIQRLLHINFMVTTKIEMHTKKKNNNNPTQC